MPFIGYTTGIPDENNDPSADQPNMKINTDAINQILGVDLYSFNDNNGGNHQKSTYVAQNPGPSSVSGKIVQYGAIPSGSSSTELFINRDGVPASIQLTNGTTVKANVVTIGVNTFTSYQSFLPGGILIKSGVITKPTGSGSVTVTYASIGLTNFTAAVVPSVTLSSNAANSTVNVFSSTDTGFVILRSDNFITSIYWTAIGY
jgi:hypothetical protein